MPAPANDRFFRIGSHVSADFVNTVYDPDHSDGSLRSAKDVIDFLLVTELLEQRDALELRRALGESGRADAFLRAAVRLRDVTRKALAAIEAGRALEDEALTSLNGILRSDAGFERLERGRGRHYELRYQHLKADPLHALAPLARKTAELLATPGVPARRCAGDGCVRYFVDESRTGRRRWCDMAICGNRAKANAFAERRRRGSGGA